MAGFKLTSFGGMRPAQEPDRLPQGEAQLAVNTDFTSGAMLPIKAMTQPGVTFAGGTVLSMYRFGQTMNSETQYWFQSTADCDFVRGPVNNDTTERTYWTDGTYPKKTDASMATVSTPYPTNSYRMGIPAPASAPSVAVSGTATNANDDPETSVYVVTYVSAWGEEGPPSAASASVSWRPGQTVNLTSLPVAPGGAYNIAGKRLYRSAIGSSGAGAFELVNTTTDIAIATTTYNDTAATSALGDALATTGWLPPPDNMVGLCAMANGILAGFFGNTLCFSEPGAPYAWPVRYRRSTDAPIVGIAAFDQSLFVGTTQGLYVVTGTDPGAFSQDKLPQAQSVASKRSIVPMMGGVIFAAPDGLYRVSGSGVQCITEGLFTRKEWQVYKPSSFSAFENDNSYIIFYDTGAKQAGLVFTFGNKPSFCETDRYATAGYRDKKAESLFLATGNVLQKWDSSATPLTLDYTSGIYDFSTYINLGAARVLASAYPVTFKLYADGVLKHTQTVADAGVFRLPAGYRSRRYHFAITATSTVREVAAGETVREVLPQ